MTALARGEAARQTAIGDSKINAMTAKSAEVTITTFAGGKRSLLLPARSFEPHSATTFAGNCALADQFDSVGRQCVDQFHK